MFANLAAFAIAEVAGDIHFCAGFCEGEVAGAEACFSVLTEQSAGEFGECAFEVGEGDVFANGQSFYLQELEFAAGGDLFVAVAHAGQDDADGFWVVLAHGANLSGAGVCAQDDVFFGGVEAVLHFACGVVGWEVEQFEVVGVGFYVWAAVDLEAHVAEDAVDLAQGLGGWVEAAVGWFSAGQGDVYGGLGEAGFDFGFFNGRYPFLVGFF